MANDRLPEVDLERRRISVLTALALLGGATITMTGCGGSSPAGTSTPPEATPPSATGTCLAGNRCAVVVGDARHSAVITAAQLSAGGALVLDIEGTAGHSHIVSLTEAEVVMIRGGQQVRAQSSVVLQHGHLVVFG